MTKRYPTLFDIVSKIEHTNATVSELRVPIFSPLIKVSHNSIIATNFRKNRNIRTVSTSWGESTTRGRVLLGQLHRDLLDCIYLNATRYDKTEHGSMRIYFCQRQVLISYFGTEASGKNNHKWLRIKLEEIRDTAIAFKNTQGDSFDFNIIKHLDFHAKRGMFCIELDERYVQFYAQDLSVNYQKLLPSILSIKNSVIKTIVRFLLSHSNIKISLEKTLLTIGYPFDDISKVNQRVLKKELLEYKELLKKEFTIIYDDDFKMFEYVQHSDIAFISSQPNTKELPTKTMKIEELSINSLIGRSITRAFFEVGVPITAKICQITDEQYKYRLKLLFPDGTIKEVDTLFSSLEEIEKISSPL